MSLAGPLIIAAAVMASDAVACEPEFYPRDFRIAVGNDCSFKWASRANDWSGRPVQDIGSGLVVQRQHLGGCTWHEALVISDCVSGRTGLLMGELQEGSMVAGMVASTLEPVLHPTGRLAIMPGQTLEQVIANARELDVDVMEDISLYERLALHNPWMEDERPARRDTPDPMCGCRLFYPDSPGATQ